MPPPPRPFVTAGLLGSPLRNLGMGVGFVLTVMTLSTLAYVAAGWKFGDAVYMVIMTVYTVGYGEVRPIDTVLLRTITIATIVFGCTGTIFVTGALVQFITISQLTQIFGLKRMNTRIDQLKDHVVICGFGRLGTVLAHDLHQGGANFVVLEMNDAESEHARNLGYLCLQGDATDEDALRAAGIERARTLATVLPNDAANVFITLSARSLNPELEIIARGELPSTERKLLQAGANHVILPTHIGAERIAEMILYKETARFLRGSGQMKNFEAVLHTLGLEIDVVSAAPDSPIVGQTVEAVEQESQGAFFIVQLTRRDGDTVTNPAPDLRIEAGDGLVFVGRGAKTRALTGLFSATAYRTGTR
ncbi:MAG: NAD-binding protein [Rhodospirillales bacterium]